MALLPACKLRMNARRIPGALYSDLIHCLAWPGLQAPANGPSSQAPPSQQAPAAPSSGRKATPSSASRAKSSAGAAAGQGLDGSAVAAIAAVDAAVRALPAESDVKFSVMAEDGNAQGNDAAEPPNAGSKVSLIWPLLSYPPAIPACSKHATRTLLRCCQACIFPCLCL